MLGYINNIGVQSIGSEKIKKKNHKTFFFLCGLLGVEPRALSMCTPPKKLEEYPPFTEGGLGGPHRGFSCIRLFF